MVKNRFTMGIEIEGCYYLADDIEVGGYGSENGDPLGTYWQASTDGSITAPGFSRALEIVSNILTVRNYRKALKEFQKEVGGNDHELTECVRFNNSCGCHIHFRIEGAGRNYMNKKFSSYRVSLMKEIFFKRLNNAVKKGLVREAAAKKIKKRYFRGYASNNQGSRGRRGSLHWSDQWGTLEWRSFNLTGINTWKEFFTVMDVAVSSIDEFITRHRKPLTVVIRTEE